MNYKRIIPRLDIKDHNLVKGINLEGLRVLGEPEYFANLYTKEHADEIIYQDTVASLYGKSFMLDVINKVAKKTFIPFTVGGGIKNLKDIEDILQAGADKISINSETLRNPKIIDDSAKKFGSSTISVNIQFNKIQDQIKVLIDNGREIFEKNILEWIKEVEERGAGEIILTDISREGTGIGGNIDIISSLVKNIKIPTLYHGGFGKKEHVLEILKIENVDGVCLSSILHYSVLKNTNNQIINNKSEIGNTQFLEKKNHFGNFEKVSLLELKKFLKKNNINTRLN
tara:strand:+ start:44989 stop:45843 length:855 start_codon:yes stop_codon:yes gene_type:complete